MRSHWLGFTVAVRVWTAGITAATAAPAPCPEALYTIVGDPVGGAGVTSSSAEIGVRAGFGDACPPTTATKRSGSASGITKVSATWTACSGLTGTVKFSGKIVDSCSRLVGTLKAKGYKRALEAVRVDCGDGILEAEPPATPYTGTLSSLATHALPPWFDDAKFGIMIHWGIFTIPAWAETILNPADWLCGSKLVEPPDFGSEFFTHIPYVEWYENTIMIAGSPAQQHHIATYGATFAYDSFRPQFEAQAAAWSGDTWADLFRDSGARYVVLVTKHHDGYALWPTTVAHPTRSNWHMERDIVGELSTAVRQRCMRMGLYYSGGFDWSVQAGPVKNSLDYLTVAPQSPAYISYADGQWRELISRYKPAILWNDLGYPTNADALSLFADYYNTVPDGVINDRFTVVGGGTHHDYTTPEFCVVSDISPTKFETVRGMGHGFGYNQNETDADLASADDLIRLLIDVVSKNGNLLLNVGPLADGTIPTAQVTRLQAIGAWLSANGAAIFKTHPWTVPAGATSDGTPVRFTTSADGATLYAMVLGSLPAKEVTLVGLNVTPKKVVLLGTPAKKVKATVAGSDLHIKIPAAPPSQAAYAFALTL
ncbi:MAG TPA: alpha-L-fucosidase [Candidatus Margulisiibacteriota bacterium]|nr:alpha-L-fucosidase [Candidatus Margulisiibacteriota bacterium]